jgi:osmotically inducible lipoprotein OsmB
MDSQVPKAWGAAALAFALAACAHLPNDETGNASERAALSDPGHVVSGGSTAGTLSGAAVGGIVGHEVARP